MRDKAKADPLHQFEERDVPIVSQPAGKPRGPVRKGQSREQITQIMQELQSVVKQPSSEPAYKFALEDNLDSEVDPEI